MTKMHIPSGTKWEPLIGYSRAVKVGNHIYVSGTTATINAEEICGIDDPYEQTVQTIKNIETVLAKAGAKLSDVVRTRIYVTDMNKWEAVGKAHREFFGEIRPATSMVEVSRLIDDRLLVEIEAEAVVNK